MGQKEQWEWMDHPLTLNLLHNIVVNFLEQKEQAILKIYILHVTIYIYICIYCIYITPNVKTNITLQVTYQTLYIYIHNSQYICLYCNVVEILKQPCNISAIWQSCDNNSTHVSDGHEI